MIDWGEDGEVFARPSKENVSVAMIVSSSSQLGAPSQLQGSQFPQPSRLDSWKLAQGPPSPPTQSDAPHAIWGGMARLENKLLKDKVAQLESKQKQLEAQLQQFLNAPPIAESVQESTNFSCLDDRLHTLERKLPPKTVFVRSFLQNFAVGMVDRI